MGRSLTNEDFKNPNNHVGDADHIFIAGRQFVSLERFGAMKVNLVNESTLETGKLMEEVIRLTSENNALRTLLKEG